MKHGLGMLLLLAASVAAADGQVFPPRVVTAVPNKRQETPDNLIRTKAACDARHGEWLEGEGYKYCVVPYADAGKLCRNSKGCQGHCLWPLDGKTLDHKAIPKGYGICQPDDRRDDCGRPQFENGKITYFKCD
jgi:hypothetical protein